MASSSAKTKSVDAQNYKRAVNILRRSLLVVLATITCSSIISYTTLHFMERQIFNTDNYVVMVTPIPQTPVVATALSGYITNRIFNSSYVQQEIQNALPAKAAFLTGPLASQLQTLTDNVVKKLILSAAFQAIWVEANKTAMNNLLANARGQKPSFGGKLNQLFNLNLNGVKGAVSKALGNTSLAIPSLSSNSGNLNLSANLKQKRERVWHYVRTVDFWSAVLPLTIVAALFGSLALSHDRRRTLLLISLVIIVLLLVQLIGLKIGRQDVLDQVKDSNYKDAVGFVYDSITADLRKIIYSWLAIWTIILIISGLSGPSNWAVNFRTMITSSLRFHGRLLKAWHEVRTWFREYCYQIWLAVFIVFLVWLAFPASVSMREIINDVLAAVLVFEIVYIIAFPRIKTGL